MKIVNIGILGCAEIAKKSIIPTLQNLKEFNCLSIASRHIDTATRFSNEFNCEPIEGYQNLIDRPDIEAVYIPLPNGLHYEWVVKALKAKKHVFCEKSLATNLKEVKQIVELAKANNCVVFENFMFPYHTQIDFVKKLLIDNQIGEVRAFRSSFGFPLFKQDTNIRYKKELGGGALLDAGAYTIKGAQLFLGNELSVESAHLNFNGREVDFFGGATLINTKKIPAQILFGFDNFYQNNIELWGSKGKIVMERAYTAGFGVQPKVIVEKQGEKTEFVLPADNHFMSILKDFYQKIIDNNFSSTYDDLINQAKLINEINTYGK